MSFNVTFYTSTANPKQLDKSGNLAQIGTTPATINAKHTIDIYAPVFTVNYDSTLLPATYCYIDTFGLYYFIDRINTDTAQKMVISAVCDPLYSYMSSIKNCDVTVVRSEAAGINYTPDSKLPIDPNRIATEGIPFDTSLSNVGDGHNYILVLNKGSGN